MQIFVAQRHRDLVGKNKRPGLMPSREANVDQPSPECCSIGRIDQFATTVNGH